MLNAIEKLNLDSENEVETGSVYIFYLPNLEVILSRSLSLCDRDENIFYTYKSIVIGWNFQIPRDLRLFQVILRKCS